MQQHPGLRMPVEILQTQQPDPRPGHRIHAQRATVIQKKICMLGSFGVGKTSLVSQYVRSIFSDKYLSTVGVKVDKKEVVVDNQRVNLVLWDLYGEDGFQTIQQSYLRGTSGYLLVADGTRFETLAAARDLRDQKLEPGSSFAQALVSPADRKNPSIYLSPEVQKASFVQLPLDAKIQRIQTRLWTEVKTRK